MGFMTHKFFSWLLVLALVIGPIQGSLALDETPAVMTIACLQMMDDGGADGPALADLQQPPCGQPSSPAPCPGMDGCTGTSHLNPAALISSGPLAHALVIRVVSVLADARLTTRYPDLLQRPPQA